MTTPKGSAKIPITSTAAPISSKETSVTPRQRPKACQLNPVNANQFTIGLPPSPSPRNILSSPTDGQNKAPSMTPDNFNAQFEVDFTNIDNQMAPVASSQVATTLTTNSSVNRPQEVEKFDNLFKSSMYPDPFGENDDEIVEIQTNYVDTQKKTQQMFNNAIGNQQQVTAKVSQHRRYLSDTSGFKRYQHQEILGYGYLH